MSSSSLRDRVPDLGASTVPDPVGGVTWRRPTLADAHAIHAVYVAAGHVDHPHFTIPLEDVRAGLEASWIDLDRDALVAEAGGTIVAAGVVDLTPGQETLRRVHLDGVVHPNRRGRGVGSALLDWQQRRGAELLRADEATVPGRLVVWAESTQHDLLRLAGAHGLETARWFLELHRDLAAPIEEVPLEGYRVVTLSPELHEAARIARNDSFRDHWGSQPTIEERWQRFVTGELIRPDLSFLALADDGAVAGFSIGEHNPDDTEGAGFSSAHVALVGVVRAHRRKGIAPALLARTLRASAAAGLERAVLEVDVDSPTGAVGLYERLGFVEERRSQVLARQW